MLLFIVLKIHNACLIDYIKLSQTIPSAVLCIKLPQPVFSYLIINLNQGKTLPCHNYSFLTT